MTNTTTSDWAQLSGGSTTGRTLGAAGTTTYYYANSDLTFTNSTEGGSGLTILGTVYLYVPKSVTITCMGADASGATGAGAGIELALGNALCLLGSGTVNATGGNAADGANGAGGGDANWDSSNYWSGTAGSGGAAGAASTSEQATTVNMKQPTQDEWDMVCRQTQTSQSQWRTLPLGVRKGATIGAAGTTTYYLATYDRSFTNSTVGGSGLTILGTVYLFISSGNQITCTGAHASGTTGAGAGVELTAGNTLYLIGSGKLVATGGNAANGINGQNGGDASFVDTSGKEWIRSGDGGAGGAGGGFGGAASDIGTGGPGGGGGGGGASGSIQFRRGTVDFYQVGALGGSPDANGDGTLTGAGESTMINSDNTNVVSKHIINDEGNLGWYSGDNRATGGTGGNTGSAAKSGTPYLVPASISLADNADNSATINTAKGYLADVTLQGRTLYKDGSWNTLCLPFSLDSFDGTPLEGPR